MNGPPVELVSRVEALFSSTVSWSGVDGGYTGAGRWLVKTHDDTSFFVKAGLDEKSTRALRDEVDRYQWLAQHQSDIPIPHIIQLVLADLSTDCGLRPGIRSLFFRRNDFLTLYLMFQLKIFPALKRFYRGIDIGKSKMFHQRLN